MEFSKNKVKKVSCPLCHARAKHPCRDRSGRILPVCHVVRVQKRDRRQVGDQVPVSPRLPAQRRYTAEEREEYRARVRQVPCPLCGAGPNERCRSRRPQGRLSVHRERSLAWQRSKSQVVGLDTTSPRSRFVNERP